MYFFANNVSAFSLVYDVDTYIIIKVAVFTNQAKPD